MSPDDDDDDDGYQGRGHYSKVGGVCAGMISGDCRGKDTAEPTMSPGACPPTT